MLERSKKSGGVSRSNLLASELNFKGVEHKDFWGGGLIFGLKYGIIWSILGDAMGIFNPDYRDMITCLQGEGVEFMLVGGYAVGLYGWPRMTFDIDFWVWANEENAGKVMRALRKFGAPLMDLAEEDFHRPGMVFQIGTAPQRIDLLSGVDGVRYEDAVKRAVEMEVDGLKLKVISLDDLIVNKKASGLSLIHI